MRRLLTILALCSPLVAAEVELRAPLTTVYEQPMAVGTGRVALELTVPASAPADLGVGVCAIDRDGGWWQRPLAARLVPGRHRFSVDLSAGAALAAQPPPAEWAPLRRSARLGVYLWSTTASRARIGIDAQAGPAVESVTAPRLMALQPGPSHLAVGERYTVTLGLEPVPVDAWGDDPLVTLRITEPGGTVREVGAFLREPMRSVDRGDREDMRPSGPLHLACRFRPRLPGRHGLELRALWSSGGSARVELPPVEASGAPSTGIVRVDAVDPRFFSIDGELWWPIGLNINNTYDLRSKEVNGTRLTPARGTLTYAAILDRLALSGGDAAEVWLSSWNLAPAWREDWPGYHGVHAPSLANAERLDAILDHAWSRGIRLKLVLNNHGQASPNADREWKDNPLNRLNGGPCSDAAQLFVDPVALAFQDRVRRYLVARYADHPAVWGWKLWSEIDLTAGRGEPLVRWHEQAAARLHLLDPSGRPVCTHWAGDYRRVNPDIAALPGIDYLCLDAYRRAKADRDPAPLADILAGSLHDPTRGLSRFAKPVLVTEFGASSGSSPEDFRAVDHLIGGWIGLVSGHAAAPMLWWWEWVDQGNRWAPFGAVSRFAAGEDLRGPEARSLALVAEAPSEKLWSRAWIRPGRAIGYVLAAGWGARGGELPLVEHARIRLSDEGAAGTIAVEWWDATTGGRIGGLDVVHSGGALDLRPPPFHGHLGWKAVRRP